MTVTFSNRGLLDLTVVRTMGVSVKEGATPIGYFGTGLKYAIATLLRTGHRVEIYIGEERHELGTVERTIRDQEFSIVTLDGEALAYTTALGRNWEPWQAYRELRSNAMDEPDHVVTFDPPRPTADRTTIVVRGGGIDKAHSERATIFTEAPVLHRLQDACEIREGASAHLFYRGVRAASMEGQSLYTYNLLGLHTLTEDRTIANAWEVASPIARTIASLEDRGLIERILRAPQGMFEHSINFAYADRFSDTFLDVVRENRHDRHLNLSAIEAWMKRQSKDFELHQSVQLDSLELDVLERARQLCRVIDPDYSEAIPAMVVADLGEGVMGTVQLSRVYIARHTLTQGVDMTAGTLYEEYLHARKGMRDTSRRMQNHLMDTVVRLARRAERTLAMSRVEVQEHLDYASSYGDFTLETPDGVPCTHGGTPMGPARRGAMGAYMKVLGHIPKSEHLVELPARQSV